MNRSLTPTFSQGEFDNTVSSMTEKQKLDLCLEFIRSPNKANEQPSAGIGDMTALSQAIAKGFKDGVRSANDNRVTLNRATEKSSSTIEGLVVWLQQGENAERDIEKRIQLITSKSSECPWMTAVSETPPEDLSPHDTWRWYVHRWCYEVRPDYVEYLETAIKSPKRETTVEVAKKKVTRTFNAYSWLQKLFPEEMGNVMATDRVKADMLMSALPQQISTRIKPHLVSRTKTFQLVWQHALSMTTTEEDEDRQQRPSPRKRKFGDLPIMAVPPHGDDETTDTMCQLCGASGHVALECSFLPGNRPTLPMAAVPIEERKCYSCGQVGHMASECRNTKRETRNCYKCGRPGHIAKDCRSSRPSGKDHVRCYNCGQKGHYKSQCTQAPGGPPTYPPPRSGNREDMNRSLNH